MRVPAHARIDNQPRVRVRRAQWSSWLAIVTAVLVALCLPIGARAQTAGSEQSHSLAVNLQFPDDGVASGEQLCVALFAGSSPDLTQPPLLSRCLDAGGAAVSFEGLRAGDYSVLLPGPGSTLDVPRYQGELVATSIPDDNRLTAYGIDVKVGLTPEYAGTTGRIEVNVYGCPAGTNAGSNQAAWASECHAVADGVPLTLSGTGSIQDAAFRGVTGDSGGQSGRVEFTDLPAGAYSLGGKLPDNVTSTPALFVESSIDGSLGSVSPNDTLALRPDETVAVDVYLVLDPNSTNTPDGSDVVGLIGPEITGGVSPDDAQPAETPGD
jgi:hypothetical protein